MKRFDTRSLSDRLYIRMAGRKRACDIELCLRLPFSHHVFALSRFLLLILERVADVSCFSSDGLLETINYLSITITRMLLLIEVGLR